MSLSRRVNQASLANLESVESPAPRYGQQEAARPGDMAVQDGGLREWGGDGALGLHGSKAGLAPASSQHPFTVGGPRLL